MSHEDPDTLRTTCPNCGEVFALQPEWDGGYLDCPACGIAFEVHARLGAGGEPAERATRLRCPECGWQHLAKGDAPGLAGREASPTVAQKGARFAGGTLIIILLAVGVPVLVGFAFLLFHDRFRYFRTWPGGLLGAAVAYVAGRFVLTRGGEGWWWLHLLTAGAVFALIMFASIAIGGPGIFFWMALSWLVGMVVSRLWGG